MELLEGVIYFPVTGETVNCSFSFQIHTELTLVQKESYCLISHK